MGWSLEEFFSSSPVSSCKCPHSFSKGQTSRAEKDISSEPERSTCMTTIGHDGSLRYDLFLALIFLLTENRLLVEVIERNECQWFLLRSDENQSSTTIEQTSVQFEGSFHLSKSCKCAISLAATLDSLIDFYLILPSYFPVGRTHSTLWCLLHHSLARVSVDRSLSRSSLRVCVCASYLACRWRFTELSRT